MMLPAGAVIGQVDIPVATNFSIIGLQFHTYGLLIGLGLVVSLTLAERAFQFLLQQKKLLNSKNLNADQAERIFNVALVIGLLAGLLGARTWHVVLHWGYYSQNVLEAFQAWSGGMSIIGGVLAAWLAVRWWLRKRGHEKLWPLLIDAAAVSMPVGQIIGRWGNFFNQELYGAPTNVPWSLYIDEAHRLAGYETITRYHPLFLYEIILLIIWFGLLWMWRQQFAQSWRRWFGSGRIFASYIAYYALIRFVLDFVRLEKVMLGPIFSFNQVVLAVVFVGISWHLWQQRAE